MTTTTDTNFSTGANWGKTAPPSFSRAKPESLPDTDRFAIEKGLSARGTTGSPSKSSKLLLEATRNFGCIQRPSREEIEQYKELFYQFIETVAVSEKRLISAMLARGVFTPRPVALYLAQDKADVAAPFLLYSPVLGDLDLRAIAKKKGAEHAAIVAKRRLPMDNFTISTLHQEISKPLEQKAEKPEVKFIAPAADSVKTAATSKWLQGEEIVALASIGGRLGQKQRVAKETVAEPRTAKQTRQSLGHQLPKSETQTLLKLARMRKTEQLASYVEEICGLEQSATLKLIRSEKTELTYLIKALGLTAPNDIQILLMLSPSLGRDVATYRETKALLSNLDTGICRMVFNEIGAQFEIKSGVKPNPAAQPDVQGFDQAIQRRRESLDRSPNQYKQAPAGRFTFEKSFLASS